MGGCQNYGPILGTLNIRCRRDPKRDHIFDNHPNADACLRMGRFGSFQSVVRGASLASARRRPRFD